MWVTDVGSKKPVAVPVQNIVRFISVNCFHTQTIIELTGGIKQECEENIVPLTDTYARKMRSDSVDRSVLDILNKIKERLSPSMYDYYQSIRATRELVEELIGRYEEQKKS